MLCTHIYLQSKRYDKQIGNFELTQKVEAVHIWINYKTNIIQFKTLFKIILIVNITNNHKSNILLFIANGNDEGI